MTDKHSSHICILAQYLKIWNSSKKNPSVAKRCDITHTEIMPCVVGDRTDFQPEQTLCPKAGG